MAPLKRRGKGEIGVKRDVPKSESENPAAATLKWKAHLILQVRESQEIEIGRKASLIAGVSPSTVQRRRSGRVKDQLCSARNATQK